MFPGGGISGVPVLMVARNSWGPCPCGGRKQLGSLSLWWPETPGVPVLVVARNSWGPCPGGGRKQLGSLSL